MTGQAPQSVARPSGQMPLPIRVLNRCYRGTRLLGGRPMSLDKERLLQRAMRRAGGLTDFGDDRFETGLDHLIASIETEDRLNGFGRVMAQEFITNLLHQRLLLAAHLDEHPEIADEEIARPIFIIGAPRTGTTITHHLLSQDRRFRFPITWECDHIHPPIDPDAMEHDPRIGPSQKNLDRMLRLAPNLDVAHPVGAWEAQECAMLHTYDFHSGAFHPMFNCQGYDRWLAAQDLTWVYEQQRRMLQYLQSGGLRPTESWLLKTPAHMGYLDQILSIFPDARFVTTVREPTEVIVSLCSLTRTLIEVVQDHVDLHELGQHELWRVGGLLNRNVELRRELAGRDDQFVDFPMRRMVTDPLSCVAEIYDRFGITLTREVQSAMEEFMQRRALGARRPHRYDPSDYGLDVDAIWSQFQDYRDYYRIMEQAS